MDNLPRLMPHVLNQTAIDRPGWRSRARLVGIVASRTWHDEGLATRIGLRDLEAYGRSRPEARWDLELLDRLADDDRILTRVRTPRRNSPDLWSIRGRVIDDLRGWRHVPWTTSAPAAIRSLRALESAVGAGAMTVGAGQDPFLMTVRPSQEYPAGTALSAKGPSWPPHQPSWLPHLHAQEGPSTVIAPAPTDDSSPCFSERDSLSRSLGSERASGDRPTSTQIRVRAELSRALKRPVHGVMRDRLYAVVEVHQDHVEELLEFIRNLKGSDYVEGAIETLEGWTPAILSGRRKLTPERAANLRAMIPIWEASGHPDLEAARADLAEHEQAGL